MASPYHAIAIDYDGTLTDAGAPSGSILTALRQARDRGLKLVLVTGRILEELRREFPGYRDHFDAVVGENGCVLSRNGKVRLLAPAIPSELCDALAARGIPFRRGEVLVATETTHDHAILAEIARLGFDCQLVRNRGALMVLPSGVSKGSGLYQALGDLGVSHHNTIGIGDAENDHSLLEVSEVGVAVSNAVASLKEAADLVLEEPDGVGIAALLTGALIRGDAQIHPKRWQIGLGAFEDGSRVEIPASGVNLLVRGDSGTGKSFLAGLIAERLLDLDYSVCVIDPDGDHVPIAQRRGVVLLGGTEALPPADEIGHVLRHRFGSVVLDLSQVPVEKKPRYCRDALKELSRVRGEVGTPHWIVLDEAHLPFGAISCACDCYPPDERGLCLVTYRPRDLCADAASTIDLTIEVTRAGDSFAATLSAGAAGTPRRFTPDPRLTSHVRHWHKYAEGQLPIEKRFYFRGSERATGRSAGNLHEFHREVEHAASAVLHHHARHGDFSRWVDEVVGDRGLASHLRALERQIKSDLGAERARSSFLRAIETSWYGTVLV